MENTRHDPRSHPDPAWIEQMRQRYPVEHSLDRVLVRKLAIRNQVYRPLTLATARQQIEDFLTHTLSGPFTVSDVRMLSGGASKEQYAFRLQWTENGQARDEPLVLRVQPAQSAVETDRLREFQIVHALKNLMPVPMAYWVDNDARYFQHPALIYGFCEGVAKPPEKPDQKSVRGGYGEYSRVLLPQFIDCMAKMAKFDPSGHDLSAYDIPVVGSNEAVIKSINYFERAWEEDRLEAVPLLTLVAQWLRDNAPPLDHVSLVHNDYRAGNYLFDPADGRITAVLDWELAYFGDRHADLAFTMTPALCEVDENGEMIVAGLCGRQEFIQRYEAATGLPVDHDRIAYYEIYNNWRAALICNGSAARCIVERKSHQNIVLAFITLVGGVMLGNLQEIFAKRIAHDA